MEGNKIKINTNDTFKVPGTLEILFGANKDGYMLWLKFNDKGDIVSNGWIVGTMSPYEKTKNRQGVDL